MSLQTDTYETLHWPQRYFILLLLLLLPCKTGYARGTNPVEEKKTHEKKGENFFKKSLEFLLREDQITIFGQQHFLRRFPILFYNARTGFNFGFQTNLQNKQKQPYLYKIELRAIFSDRGSHKHKLFFDYPEIRDSKFGIVLDSYWERELEGRYYGIGNHSVNDKSLTEKGSPDFIDEDFYIYNFKRPRLTLYSTYQILPNMLFWFGYGFKFVDPQLKTGIETSFLALDRPFGHLGGSGHRLVFRLSWDTRSNKIYPTRGFLTEFSFEPDFESVTEEVLNNGTTTRQQRHVTFYRYTLSDAHFISLASGKLTFANRMVFEAIAGDAPFYALGNMAGQRSTRVVGGSQSLRGFKSRRFQDKLKFITLTELRYKFKHLWILSQPIDFIAIAFFDNGRVWHRWSELSPDDFHKNVGFGLWLNWRNKIIMRFDVGHSEEETNAYIRFGSSF